MAIQWFEGSNCLVFKWLTLLSKQCQHSLAEANRRIAVRICRTNCRSWLLFPYVINVAALDRRRGILGVLSRRISPEILPMVRHRVNGANVPGGLSCLNSRRDGMAVCSLSA